MTTASIKTEPVQNIMLWIIESNEQNLGEKEEENKTVDPCISEEALTQRIRADALRSP
jgi:hypothetical protein